MELLEKNSMNGHHDVTNDIKIMTLFLKMKFNKILN